MSHMFAPHMPNLDLDNDSLFADPEELIPAEIDDEDQGSEIDFDERFAGGPSSKRLRTDSNAQQGGEDAGSNSILNTTLFGIVRSGRQTLQAVIDDWIESYKQDRDSALLELINFFIHCCGCKGTVTAEMFAAMDQTNIIKRMTEEFDEESGDYPLIQSGPIWKKFKTNFTEFIIVLVRQCQFSIIFDQYMCENIISLLTVLCDSPVRAFRHTSIMAAMKLMTALVTVATNLNIQREKLQRQYESERCKSAIKRASGRVEMLKSKMTEYEENLSEIQGMMTNLFNGIFVHRYRDTHPDIRAICMGEIGTWIKNYPSMFLDDSYLKYVGWNLHDKHWDVRLRCLTALHSLYASEELAQSLELFTNRFKDRIVAMILDKKVEVAVAAIKLITYVSAYNEDVLNEQDCENVYQLVYSSHRAVAQAAGAFLHQRLFVRDDSANETPHMFKSAGRKGRRQSANAPLLRDLVQFFIESELHEHAAYLVDALWDAAPEMLRDWECMTSLLLEQPLASADVLDERQETHLIDVMACCVRQASEGLPPVGRRATTRKALSGRERAILSEERGRITSHFAAALPHLLGKFGVDADKVGNLVLLPQYFDLDVYRRLEQHLEPLLKLLVEIVTKHTDPDVLHNSAKTLEVLCGGSSRTGVLRSALVDHLSAALEAAWADWSEEASSSTEYQLTASLKRIAAFYSSHDLNGWPTVFSVLMGIVRSLSVPHQCVCLAVGSLQHAVMWARCSLEDSDKSAIRRVKKMMCDVMDICRHLLVTHPALSVRQEAYTNICDLLIVFGKQIAFIKTLRPLVYICDNELQQQLADFVENHVFVHEEEETSEDDDDEAAKIEALHTRRNLLSCFCKLIIFNNINPRAAAHVFKHYLRYYNDFGDIIKATMARVNDNDRVVCARTIVHALRILWDELPRRGGTNEIERGSETWSHIRDLARNFSVIFSLDQIKSRDAIQALHREGIDYALATETNEGKPKNLDFLEIQAEFSNKLMKQDKRSLLNHLEKKARSALGENWIETNPALSVYRLSLLQGDQDLAKTAGRSKAGAVPLIMKGKRGRKRKNEDHEEHHPTPAATPHPPEKSARTTRAEARAQHSPSEDDSSYVSN